MNEALLVVKSMPTLNTQKEKILLFIQRSYGYIFKSTKTVLNAAKTDDISQSYAMLCAVLFTNLTSFYNAFTFTANLFLYI